ncbi:hypothetical protein ACFSGI_00020 [Paenibacillus nicotianae]|uniref:YD repeat-containing protein n=1 Tax=Paenibacillus nicotianae TaxID=1526551 RepID=A0ABW4UM55_9BACL
MQGFFRLYNQSKNSNGVTSNYTYDALNRLTAVQDGIDQTTRYAYDGTGGLTKITVNDLAGKSETLYTKAQTARYYNSSHK